ncbi:hypothetical protein [Hyalangium rubrum]|uniref:Pilus biogenesis operon protein n=1 Tax=Hyalangium rubrum TaxID=3103134 RepID=A0ABU5H069_9BACT|nr:hypothetical protein [Hyalangium sp. s54d21]MDY7226182.1 hypothetical protein [Hyalangium sp. s54d21]
MVTARSRGQALLETALGLLVFITILVFGLHFAEVGFLSLKVQEANASALWHATAAKMHELPGDFTPVRQLISEDTPGSEATRRYRDFDGRTSRIGDDEVRLVFTRASALQVRCDAGASGLGFAPVERSNTVFEDVGAMRCRSQASMEVLEVFPQSFLDSGVGAFFRERHLNPLKMTLCGVGRAQGGSCPRGFRILLDDWGLASGTEVDECKVLKGNKCENPQYYQSTHRIYMRHLPRMGASLSLAQQTVGQVPGGFDPSTFYMSFRVFQEEEPGGDSDPNNWVTTPGKDSPTSEYHASYGARGKCFLGRACPR